MAISRWEEEEEDINREEISRIARRDTNSSHPLRARIHTWRILGVRLLCVCDCSKTQVNKFDSSSNYKEGANRLETAMAEKDRRVLRSEYKVLERRKQ